MRKNLLLIIAIIAIVAVGVTSLVACKDTDEVLEGTTDVVQDFVDKIADAKYISLEMTVDGMSTIMRTDGNIAHTKNVVGGTTTEMYVVKEGTKYYSYSKLGTTKWSPKTEMQESLAVALIDSTKLVQKYVMLDKSLYNIKDGVWTSKADDSLTLKIEGGKLVMQQDTTKVIIEVSDATIKLPTEIGGSTGEENPPTPGEYVPPTTVDEFIQKLNTATSYQTVNPALGLTRFDGKTRYIEVASGDTILKGYYCVEGSQVVAYKNAEDGWHKSFASPEEFPELQMSIKDYFSMILDFDKANYNVVNGVWTAKDGSGDTLRIIDGKLRFVSTYNILTIDLAPFTITIPQEVLNAPLLPKLK